MILVAIILLVKSNQLFSNQEILNADVLIDILSAKAIFRETKSN
jgi:hypothetical protein